MIHRAAREQADRQRTRRSVYRAPAPSTHEAFVRVTCETSDLSTFPKTGRRVHAVAMSWAKVNEEKHSQEVELLSSDDAIFYAGNLGTMVPRPETLVIAQQIEGRWLFDYGRIPCEDIYVRQASRYRDKLRLPWFNFCTQNQGTDEIYLCCDSSSSSTDEECCKGACDACEFEALNPHTWEFTVEGCFVSGSEGGPPDPDPHALAGTWRMGWQGNCHWSNGGDGITTPNYDFQFNYVSGCWELYGTYNGYRVGWGTAIVTGFFPTCCHVGIVDCFDATGACSMDASCDYSCSDTLTLTPVTLPNGCDLVAGA